MDLTNLTIKKVHQGLQNKDFSCKELVQAFLDKIKNKERKLNAFITVTSKQALAQAKKVDIKIEKGEEIGLLEGIPCAVKDVIITEDIRTTAGSKILENYVPPFDAFAVKKLKKEGAVFLGKTNCDEFAMGSSGENSAFGPTRNPINLEYVPGGSSSGSAAAVAAGEVVYSLGSDTGGSVRQPASFCGLVGLKPTYGLVSRYGLIAMASSLDQIGIIGKCVEDTGIVLSKISGKDKLDSTSVGSNKFQIPNSKFQINPKSQVSNLKNLRIGIPKEYFVQGIDREVEKVIKKAIKKLEEEGAKIEEVSLPHSKHALACYYIIMPAEVSANLARYDGIKYGKAVISDKKQKTRDKDKNSLFPVTSHLSLLDVYLKTRENFGDEVRRRIMLGTYTLSAGYIEAYYKKAQKVRTLIRRDFEEVFKKVDLLAAPTSPTPAFKLGEKIDDPLKMYLSDIYTVPVNLAGLPAISVPCGKVKSLPVGLQLVGKWFGEDVILKVAAAYEQVSK